MKGTLGLLFIGFTACSLAGSGCVSKSQNGRLSREGIAQAAVAAANQKAKDLYDLEPFAAEDGSLTKDRELWIWKALTSSRGFDFVAQVELSGTGTISTVNVRMLSSPELRPSSRGPNEEPISLDREPPRPAEIIEK